jgi:non-homologous end joining protein Ku
MLDVAEHILLSKTADFDPAFLEDRYRTALVSMLKEKQAELPRKASPAMPSPQNVINLMDALKRSLESERLQRAANRDRRASIPLPNRRLHALVRDPDEGVR